MGQERFTSRTDHRSTCALQDAGEKRATGRLAGNEIVVPVSGPFEADDSRVLGDATYAGLGIGIRPQGECTRAEKAGALERVLPGHRFQPRDITALLPKGRSGIPRIAACLEALREAVEELS